MNTRRFANGSLVIALILGLGFLTLLLNLMITPQTSLAYIPESINQNAINRTSQSTITNLPMPSLTAAEQSDMPLSVLSIAGSTIESDQCYLENATQTICFQVNNGSTTGEWITDVRLTFPTLDGNWQVSCLSGGQDATDSVGYAVNFSCNTPQPNVIEYTTADSDGFGEISNGASWNTCVDLTIPAAYSGNRLINWELNGDDAGNATGTTQMAQCTPLTLTPSELNIEGCNDIAQTLEFKLVNYAAGLADVDFAYNTADATFTGPTNLQIAQGETVTFTTQLHPNLCLDPGEQINASLTVQAQGSGHADSAAITQTITENGGWQRLVDSPQPSMDSVVIWTNQGDGGLWSIGGYGSEGVAQRYNPTAGSWITYTNPLTPVIEYPVDGCYGLNSVGDEIAVLFPDTLVTGTLQIFNITNKSWYTEPIPASYPEAGRWGHDVVSMIQHTGENACYLSGGADKPGGGTTRDLWRYLPETNSVSYVGPFSASVWFGFHASWYVPWIGSAGGICVAGGADHNHEINNSTQCYDIQADSFNSLNVDLGTLPEPWWGMADGWAVSDGKYQLWMANGVAQDGTLLPVSAYFEEGMTNFASGPEIPEGMYRLEGSAWNNQFYTLNGSRGGFWTSPFSFNLGNCPICNEIFLPLTTRP